MTFAKPAEKKDFLRNNIFFSCGIFVLFCLFPPPPHFITLEEDTG